LRKCFARWSFQLFQFFAQTFCALCGQVLWFIGHDAISPE